MVENFFSVMSSTVLVVDLVMEHLYPTCNKVPSIIESLASYCKRLQSTRKYVENSGHWPLVTTRLPKL